MVCHSSRVSPEARASSYAAPRPDCSTWSRQAHSPMCLESLALSSMRDGVHCCPPGWCSIMLVIYCHRSGVAYLTPSFHLAFPRYVKEFSALGGLLDLLPFLATAKLRSPQSLKTAEQLHPGASAGASGIHSCQCLQSPWLELEGAAGSGVPSLQHSRNMYMPVCKGAVSFLPTALWVQGGGSCKM